MHDTQQEEKWQVQLLTKQTEHSKKVYCFIPDTFTSTLKKEQWWDTAVGTTDD